MLGPGECSIELFPLQAVRGPDALEQVLPVRLEHDRELEIEEPTERLARRHGGVAHLGVGDARELDANERHRGEHVTLRKAYIDVSAADPHRALEVRFVVPAGAQPFHPAHQRLLETGDLLLAGEDRVRLFVLAYLLVELAGDAHELWRGVRTKLREPLRVRLREGDVSFELFEAGLSADRHVGFGALQESGRAGDHRIV